MNRAITDVEKQVAHGSDKFLDNIHALVGSTEGISSERNVRISVSFYFRKFILAGFTSFIN